jgi:hypothetical protein
VPSGEVRTGVPSADAPPRPPNPAPPAPPPRPPRPPPACASAGVALRHVEAATSQRQVALSAANWIARSLSTKSKVLNGSSSAP